MHIGSKLDKRGELRMEFWKIFATAVITAAASNAFGYFKDKKFASSKYTEDVLTKLYVPIYKILTDNLVPGDGYDGINAGQLDIIQQLIKDNPELTDPQLEKLVYGYLEDDYHNQLESINNDYNNFIYDEDRKLLDYVLISFNKTRRSLGLPYDLKYASPIVVKSKLWFKDIRYKQRRKKMKRKS